MEEIEGVLTEVIYQNEVNSYLVGILETEEEQITVVGYLPFIRKGDSLKVVGKFVEHKEYGEQFKIETFEKLMPKTLGALETYLANGDIKGVGPATASKIVNKFGEETIHVLKYEPQKLAQIKGITKDKATEISESFIENWEVWQIVGFLERFGIGADRAINYECDSVGVTLNYQAISKTISAVRKSKSKDELDSTVYASCAAIRDDYKRRHNGARP